MRKGRGKRVKKVVKSDEAPMFHPTGGLKHSMVPVSTSAASNLN
jgi:hypothetical protein